MEREEGRGSEEEGSIAERETGRQEERKRGWE